MLGLKVRTTHVTRAAAPSRSSVHGYRGIAPAPLVLTRKADSRSVAMKGCVVNCRPPSRLLVLPFSSLTCSSPSSARLFGLGVPELAVIAGVVALIYGPSKLPELGKGLGWCRRSTLARLLARSLARSRTVLLLSLSGKTAKSFQTAAKEFEKELKEELKDDDEAGASKSAGSGSSKDE